MKRIAIVGLLIVVASLVGCDEQTTVQVTAPRPAEVKTPQDFREIIRSAKEKVFPAVVFLKVAAESMASGKKVRQEGWGSGVIISPRGEVVTNWHVVDKAVEVRALLSDGTAMHAEVLGSDKDTDLALLQLKLPEDASDLPWASFGDSSALKEGDFVMAMGAPYGLSRSVSQGIISCTRRVLKRVSQYSLWLQTDAAINPGNSGGPLVDTEGLIVGINARGSGGTNLGFAIPATTVQMIVKQLRDNGKVKWSWTGLRLQPLTDFDTDMYFEGIDGVIAAQTEPESPALRAGIKPLDRVLSINGTNVSAQRDEDLPKVRRMLGTLPLNKPATLRVRRGEKVLTIKLTPREKGKVEGDELELPRWDLSVKTINQFENEDLYFYRKKGVYIYGIKHPGNASMSDLQESDIIAKIEGKDIKTLEDVKKIHAEAIKNVEKDHRIVLTVLRNGLMRQIVLDFSRDYEKE